MDDGQTTLISPPLDLSADDDPSLGYWRWYSNDEGAAPGADVFTVDVSDDGGETWVNVETVGPDGPETVGGWRYHRFSVLDLVAATADVRLRFVAADEGSGSVVEAAVDDVTRVDCADCLASPPGEVSGLRLSMVSDSVAELTWHILFGVDGYALYRGASPDASDLACLQSGIEGTSTQDDGALPEAGTAFFHVVAGQNCAGESPLGADRVPAVPCS